MTHIQRTGLSPVRRFVTIAGAAAALVAAPVFFPPPAVAAAAATTGAEDIDRFYEARSGQPLWFADGSGSAAIGELVRLLESAAIDGLDPGKYDVEAIERAVGKAWGGKSSAVRKADRLLSRAFVAYARDLRKNPGEGYQYIDPALRSLLPTASDLLDQAASAPSLERYVREMGWMNPAYAPLRRALSEQRFEDGRKRNLVRLNLSRARVLPAGKGRHVIVNAAAQKLYMYEDGRLEGTMNVVVGKQREKDKTPMIASLLRSASLNPYWNVPPDLAAERIAPNVLRHGLGYLKRQGYEVLSDWTDDATVIDPATVDWKAVADGSAEVRVRQLPGRANALGKVKYTFPNPFAIYLHDTPERKLLNEESRLFSGGCIRLEDADTLGQWMFGKRLEPSSDAPEIEVSLDRPIPVYVTYLTAVPRGDEIVFLDDVYGWDEQRLAKTASGGHEGAAPR